MVFGESLPVHEGIEIPFKQVEPCLALLVALESLQEERNTEIGGRSPPESLLECRRAKFSLDRSTVYAEKQKLAAFYAALHHREREDTECLFLLLPTTIFFFEK